MKFVLAFVFLLPFAAASSYVAAKLPSANSNLNIYALPVGQGDCTVIQCPAANGGKISIIDFGSSQSVGWSKKEAAAYLAGQEIENAILTHPDKDHVNVLEYLLQPLREYPPIIHSCPWTKYSKYFKKINSSKLDLVRSELPQCCGLDACGNISICDKAVDLNFLASGLNNCPKGGSNGDSIVTQIVYKEKKFLIPGDFEGGKRFVTRFLECAGNITSDVYRLSHHGADNKKANTPPYLDAVSPQMVFVSAGFHGVYRHPRCNLFDYLEKHSLVNTSNHTYSCYEGKVKIPSTRITNKAMHTPSVKMCEGTTINHVIQFAINTNGITPTEISI